MNVAARRARVADVLPRDCTVDVGCGSGQLTVQLAAHFDEVVGLDQSADQIANARAHEGVRYSGTGGSTPAALVDQRYRGPGHDPDNSRQCERNRSRAATPPCSSSRLAAYPDTSSTSASCSSAARTAPSISGA